MIYRKEFLSGKGKKTKAPSPWERAGYYSQSIVRHCMGGGSCGGGRRLNQVDHLKGAYKLFEETTLTQKAT